MDTRWHGAAASTVTAMATAAVQRPSPPEMANNKMRTFIHGVPFEALMGRLKRLFHKPLFVWAL